MPLASCVPFGRLPFLALLLMVPSAAFCAADADWPVYLGDKEASHYSRLEQITPANVRRLKPAWEYRSGDAGESNTQVQCNPLVIEGRIYGTTAGLAVVCLDGATGREIWRHKANDTNGVNRGLVYVEHEYGARILFGSGKWLHSLNADTGAPDERFGEGGRVDLSKGLGRDVDGLAIQANTPGIVFENLLILGTRLGEGPGLAAPGHIRAYDIRTGALIWRFNTIPQPGEAGYETWPSDAWERVGGVNVWAGFTLDEKRGIVYCPVGSATFDFWGGDRHGDNLFANCLLALNARTGERVWHYQLVRHDLWDRDPPAPPTLLTIKRDGKQVDAVAQVTKSGHVFVFDRETGEPLFPIDEVAVPPSDMPGERAAPSQPLPRLPAPFARQQLTEQEVTNRTPEAHVAVLERMRTLKPHVPFSPPSLQGTVIFPGFDGGAEWGGAAVDPNGTLYVNSNEMAWILTLVPIGGHRGPGEELYLQFCASCHGLQREGNALSNVPALIDVSKRLTEEQTTEVITKGRNAMPAWSFLAEEQRQKITAFLHGREVPTIASHAEDASQLVDEVLPKNGLPPFTHSGYKRLVDPDGYPGVRPPWGTLNAIDLNSGEYRWKVVLGEFDELTQAGVPKTGAENYGGPVVTAGGVLFIAATKDECIRAFDTRNGVELWKARLPAGGYATPATYSINGRQYVVIACGGGKMGTKSGDAYVAFALDEK
ncbi:MAG: PQQ-binding-like beta-propeller repeat protein [Opitutaceae bacterium]|nr:PQQ-binding-like beta-propeller repeat protein [Opitutaceae bacterium]